MTLYGQVMMRNATILGAGMLGIVPFGLLSLAIVTRFLSVDEFGRLSVLFAVASVVTIIGSAGFLQGTIMAVYGAVDEDVDGDSVGDFEDVRTLGEARLTSEQRRRMLGSGLLTVMIVSGLFCVVVALVGDLVVRYWATDYQTSWVNWMVVSAWTGIVWRLVHQVPRLERKPTRWSILMWLRPALTVGATLAALVAGLGINGVLLGTAAGTLLATIVGFLAFRRCYHFAPQRADFRDLWERGKVWIPLSIAVAVQTNASVLLLGALSTPTSVAFYQVANRIAQVPTYFTEGFIYAWPVIERSPISIAAKERKETRNYFASVFTFFALSTLGLLVMLCLFADSVIHLAAPAYRSAASLIPIVAAGYAAWMVFRGFFRATAFRHRRTWYALLHLVWMLPFAAVAALLMPWNASYGVAISQLVAGIVICTIYVLVDRRSESSTPFQWRRLAAAFFIGSASVVIVQLVPASLELHAAVALVLALAFPLLLLLTGVVPRRQLSTVRAIVGSLIPRRLPKRELRARVASLPDHEREAVVMVGCERRDPDSVAVSLGVAPAVVEARMVRGIRHFAGVGHATPVDHLVGGYLLMSGTTIERDAVAHYLHRMGIDMAELHILDDMMRTVARSRSALRKGRPDVVPM